MADNSFVPEDRALDTADQLAQAFPPPSSPFGFNPGVAPTGTPIGRADSVVGTVSVTRVSGARESLSEGSEVFQGDVIETPQGASLGITLLDESNVSVAENSRFVLDEVVFDPTSQSGRVAMSAVTGAFVVVSGLVAKSNPDAMVMRTPTAIIGIRGTQVGLQLDNAGAVNVVLMAEANRFVGEVIVQNNSGVLTLNQEGQALRVGALNQPPTYIPSFTPADISSTFGNALQHTAASPSGSGNGYNVTPAARSDAQKTDAGNDIANFNTAAGGNRDNGADVANFNTAAGGPNPNANAFANANANARFQEPTVQPGGMVLGATLAPTATDPIAVTSPQPVQTTTTTLLVEPAPAPVNSPALIAPGAGSTIEDSVFTASGRITVVDPDPDQSSFVSQQNVSTAHGSFYLDAIGNWNYYLRNDDPSVQALDAGETLIETITVASVDGTTSTVTITIYGAEDPSQITLVGTDSDAGAVTEDLNVSSGSLAVGGHLTVTDADTSDTAAFNTTNIVLKSSTVSGSTAQVPVALGGLSIDASGNWSYSVANSAVQYLDAGETETLVYTVYATDGTSHDVTITVYGAEDPSEITLVGTDSDAGAVTEDLNVSSGSLAVGGHLTVTDADTSDTAAFNTTNIVLKSSTVSGSTAQVPVALGGLSIDASGNWSYSVANSAVQYLGQGETETLVYTVYATDGTSHDITIMINGVNDAPVIEASYGRDGNGNPLTGPLVVSEEGLYGSNPDSAGNTDTTNSRTASGRVYASDVEGDSLSFSLNSTASLTSDGSAIVWTGAGTGTLIGTKGVGGVEIVRVAIDGSGNYTVSLSGPIDHATALGENTIDFGFTVTVNDGQSVNNTSTTSLTVRVEDDSPVVLTSLDKAFDNGTSLPVTGQLVEMGADADGHLSFSVSALPTDLKAGGLAVNYMSLNGGQTIIGYTGTYSSATASNVVFTLEGHSDGTYSFSQKQTFDLAVFKAMNTAGGINGGPQTTVWQYSDGSLASGTRDLTKDVAITLTSNGKIYSNTGGLGVDNGNFDAGEYIQFNFDNEKFDGIAANNAIGVKIGIYGLGSSQQTGLETVNYEVYVVGQANPIVGSFTNQSATSGEVQIVGSNVVWSFNGPAGSIIDAIKLFPASGSSVRIATFGTLEAGGTAEKPLTFGFSGTDGDGDPLNGQFTLTAGIVANQAPTTLTTDSGTSTASSP